MSTATRRRMSAQVNRGAVIVAYLATAVLVGVSVADMVAWFAGAQIGNGHVSVQVSAVVVALVAGLIEWLTRTNNDKERPA